jgi:phospholipid transport system transporter-binding protein
MIERDGNTLRLPEAMTLANASALRGAVGAWPADGEIVMDLAGVKEVDSSALSLLFEWQRQAAASKARVRYLNIPANLQSLAALYGVTELLAKDA